VCILDEVANQWWHSGVKVYPPMLKPVYLRHTIPHPERGWMAFVEMLTGRARQIFELEMKKEHTTIQFEIKVILA
jgi:hypothetical protein